PIALELNYFQLNRAEYFVPVAAKIPGSELALARKGGAQRTLIDFIGEVKDEFGITIQNIRGKYVLKFLARDSFTGRIGTFQTNFVIPNLNREEKRIPISTVVLSSQRVA